MSGATRVLGRTQTFIPGTRLVSKLSRPGIGPGTRIVSRHHVRGTRLLGISKTVEPNRTGGTGDLLEGESA